MTRLSVRLRHWVILAMWCWVPACQGQGEPSAGSESHFLSECSASCGSGFTCLCGVCTKQCSDDATCTPLLASAECVAVADRPAASACPSSEAPAFCDVRCSSDGDCTGLGGGFSCQGGFCRQGPGAGGDELFPNGRIEVDQLCTFYTRHVCRAKLECFDWSYRDFDDCMQTQECVGWELFQSELAAGTVAYDPVKAFACHQRLEANACGLGFLLSVPSLPEALVDCDALTGNVPEGQACATGAECQNHLICDRTSSCPGTCSSKDVVPPLGSVALGGACTPEICIDVDDDPTNDVTRCEQCQLGLTCYKSSCRPDWQIGETCSDASACFPKLWCDTTLGQCVARAEAGESCERSGFKGRLCVDGYFCGAPTFQPGTCLPKSPTGGPCVDAGDCIDSRHARCIPAEDATALGTCGPPAAAGSPCTFDEDCSSKFCAADKHCAEPTLGAACSGGCGDDFECVSQLCVKKRYLGDACGATDQCEASRCEAGLCAARAKIGQTCATDDDCISNRCSAGTCADSAGCAP